MTLQPYYAADIVLLHCNSASCQWPESSIICVVSCNANLSTLLSHNKTQHDYVQALINLTHIKTIISDITQNMKDNFDEYAPLDLDILHGLH